VAQMPAGPSLAQYHVCRVIAELKGRFDHFMKTGDDSKMPGDIIGCIFSTVRLRCSFWWVVVVMVIDDGYPVQAVKNGGREEYEFMKKIHNKPKNPMQKTCAM
jgi:aminopeptidase 2